MREPYLYISDAFKAVFGNVGGANTEEMEAKLLQAGLQPFGYLKGVRKGAPINRAFYSETQVNEFKKARPMTDAERIATLEKTVKDLLAALGENVSAKETPK